jgi:hypothetical protein
MASSYWERHPDGPFVTLIAVAATYLDPAFLRRLWHDLYGDEPRGLLDLDLEFQELSTNELLAMVPHTSESVLRRGRALLELGRRASSDPALLQQVAAMVRDPENRRLIAVGTASVSQLGTAGLIAGGGEPAATQAWELAGEWSAGERSDFAWLMTSPGSAWPPRA